ncbi:hypothetical protein [Nocardioides lijunqiniae]|uniref:hypothetical protein n=1 Tax=Nocardioides lijunqiniae TaxID=2760832 RepID=UPI001878B4DE|nr:hypothetical protein [Nocardioides lijunqiniae]
MDPLEAERLHADIEYGLRLDKAEAHEALGRRMSPGEHGRVLFLQAAAGHWMLRHEHERARALLSSIQDEPSEGVIATRAVQLELAFATDDPAWADDLLQRLLDDFRSGLLTTSTCLFVGELLLANGRLRQAQRWLTLPLSRLDPDEDLDGVEEMCVETRAQVRRQLGLPHDRYDALAAQLEAGYGPDF